MLGPEYPQSGPECRQFEPLLSNFFFLSDFRALEVDQNLSKQTLSKQPNHTQLAVSCLIRGPLKEG